MDDADIAQNIQDNELRRTLMAHAYALPKGPSALECKNCGCPIFEGRRRAVPGCQYCLGCQEILEQRHKERR